MKNKTKIRSGNKVTNSIKKSELINIKTFFTDAKTGTISKEEFQNQIKEFFDEFDQILLKNKGGKAI